jgi:pre-mRNA-processing factor 40
MYRALKSVNEKKEVFERYISEKREQTEKEKLEKYEQDKTLLRKLFSLNPEINSSVKSSKILSLVESHPEFENTNPENRRKIIDEYIEEMRQMEKDKARELRKEQLVKFKELLKSLNEKITPASTWKEAQAIFLPIIKEVDILKDIDMMDALIWFEDYVSTLDSSIRQDRQNRIWAMRRKERKVREQFTELLVELKNAKTLHINSKWKDLFPIFKNDERYLFLN